MEVQHILHQHVLHLERCVGVGEQIAARCRAWGTNMVLWQTGMDAGVLRCADTKLWRCDLQMQARPMRGRPSTATTSGPPTAAGAASARTSTGAAWGLSGWTLAPRNTSGSTRPTPACACAFRSLLLAACSAGCTSAG